MSLFYFVLGFCAGVVVMVGLRWLAERGDDMDPLDGY